MRVDEAVGSFTDAQSFERLMEESQLIFGQGVGNVAQLIGIDPHVVVSDETGNEFTIERVVSGVERAHAPVRVVVGVHADAERSVVPQRSRPPVILIVTEAIHLLVVALAVVRFDHGSFSAQFLLAPFLTFLLDLTTTRLTDETLFLACLRSRPIHVHTRAHTDPSGIVDRPIKDHRGKSKSNKNNKENQVSTRQRGNLREFPFETAYG